MLDDELAASAPRRAHPPDWLHDAARATAAEALLFARTLWAVTTRPRTFAERWADGREQAVNPLVFLATCASLVAAVFQALPWIGCTFPGDPSFAQQVVQTAGPFLQYAVAGALVHLALARVKPRVRLLDSIAIALYAAGPALVGWVASMGVYTAVWLHLHLPDPHGRGFASVLPDEIARRCDYANWAVVVLFVRSLWLGVAGLHRGRWVAAGAATLFAMATLAVALGKLHVGGPFGLQLVLVRDAGGWSLGLHD